LCHKRCKEYQQQQWRYSKVGQVQHWRSHPAGRRRPLWRPRGHGLCGQEAGRDAIAWSCLLLTWDLGASSGSGLARVLPFLER
jgi:hypothetical protein